MYIREMGVWLNVRFPAFHLNFIQFHIIRRPSNESNATANIIHENQTRTLTKVARLAQSKNDVNNVTNTQIHQT